MNYKSECKPLNTKETRMEMKLSKLAKEVLVGMSLLSPWPLIRDYHGSIISLQCHLTGLAEVGDMCMWLVDSDWMPQSLVPRVPPGYRDSTLVIEHI